MRENYKPQRNGQGEQIDLAEMFKWLFRHILIIVLVTAALAAAGYCYAKYMVTPVYSASALMIVNAKPESNTTSISTSDIRSASELVDTYSIIIKSDTCMQPVVDILGLNMSAGGLAGKVSVTSVNETQVMQITVSDTDPDRAAAIVNEITEVCPDIIIDAVEAGSVKTISTAKASYSPISPNIRKYAIAGGAIGFAVTVLVLIIIFLANNKLKDEEDVDKYLELPVLGVIPVYREKK